MPLSAQTLHALCRTLFHSLWIGVVVALLAGIVVTLTRKASPRLRYHLFCALLLLFMLGTALAFCWEWGTIPEQVLSVTGTALTGQSFNQVTGSVPLNSWTGFADRWSALIVSAWLLCAAFKSVRLTGELLYLRKVRHTGISEVSAYWQEKVSEFAKQLNIAKSVRLLESALVRIPVTLGFLRPLILLPAGTLLQLSAEQIESILYHELAHILRRDYLVNILQSFAEAVFFFNPAVWWLSALIREEREACCDELVLAQVPRKSTYLEALMIFQPGAGAPVKLALGLSLRRPQLMNRLRRMVRRENQPLNAAEKIVLLAGFALLLVFTFVPKANQAAGKGAAFVSRQVVAVIRRLGPEEPAARQALVSRRPQSVAKPADTIARQVLPDTVRRAVVPPKAIEPEPKFRPVETGFAAVKERARAVIAALVTEKVVSSQADIEWFGLSADELIVNGTRQPEALHRKLKERFQITPGNGLYYGPVQMHGQGDFLSREDLAH